MSFPARLRLYSAEYITVGMVANLRQRGFCVLGTRDAHCLQLDGDADLAFAAAER